MGWMVLSVSFAQCPILHPPSDRFIASIGIDVINCLSSVHDPTVGFGCFQLWDVKAGFIDCGRKNPLYPLFSQHGAELVMLLSVLPVHCR